MGTKSDAAASGARSLTPEAGAATANQVEPERPAVWLTWLGAKLSTEKTAVWVVLVMGGLLFFPFLGTLGLWDPWETHYGEVARAMIARDDYVYPYWESAYFFSKPALPMWLMALGMLVVGAEDPSIPEAPLGGLAEWGMRVPFALIAILSMWAVYRIGRQLRDRTTGVLAAFVLGSCPQFIFIGKQAMVDMPLVGLMTAGLSLFVAAVFDREEDGPPDRALKLLTAGGVGVAIFAQLALIGREMKSAQDLAPVVIAGLLGAAFVAFILLKASRRDCWLAGFYTFVGLSALSKGLAVLAVVGPTVVLYMLLTFDFDLLRRSKVLWGGVLFLLVAAPWYVTLSLFKGRDDEGKTFVERFWMHDNFGRVGQGVHGDRGGLAYFAEQLAYGMFPWIAVLPYALGLAARTPDEGLAAGERRRLSLGFASLDLEIRAIGRDVERRRLLLFILVWGLWCYLFFSMSQTKFHHYIFPAVPAFAVLVAYWLGWAAEAPESRIGKFATVLFITLFAVAARDLINEPQNLVNLFTYKYDRDYPREVEPRPFIIAIVSAGAAAMIFFYLTRKKGEVLLALCGVGLAFGAWISHHHFNHLSPHWSQAHLFKTFYEERRGSEPIYAYQLNWRGETYYSRNRILQVKETGANERMRALVDKPGREFIITEQSRYHTLQGVLSPDKKDKIRIIDRSSNKFYLCVVDE